MRREFKEEWERIEVPQRVALGARRRAWERLHPPSRRTFPLAIGLAAASAILILSLLWIWPRMAGGELTERAQTQPPSPRVERGPVIPADEPALAEPMEAAAESAVREMASADSRTASTTRQPRDSSIRREDPPASAPLASSRTQGAAERSAGASPKEENVATPPSPKGVEVTSNLAAAQSKRLVMHFRLPKSGVRMVWIQDPEYRDIGGGR